MTYAEFRECPEFEQLKCGSDRMPLPSESGLPRWGGTGAPPAIGTKIEITINGIGPALVTGYFTLENFLGLRCQLLNAPDWHKRQNKGDPGGHIFGPEFRLLAEEGKSTVQQHS